MRIETRDKIGSDFDPVEWGVIDDLCNLNEIRGDEPALVARATAILDELDKHERYSTDLRITVEDRSREHEFLPSEISDMRKELKYAELKSKIMKRRIYAIDRTIGQSSAEI